MRIDGIALYEGSNISNLTVASGTSFPSTPNVAEMFYRTDTDTRVRGLYVYINASWDRLASTDSLTAPSGGTLPSSANTGDLFYLSGTNAGLYFYSGSAWVLAVAAGNPTYDASQIVSGTFANARISQSSVTQYQSNLTLTSSQISDFTGAVENVVGSGFVVNGGHVTATYNSSAGTLTLGSDATAAATASTIALRDGSAGLTASLFTGSGAGLTNLVSANLDHNSVTIGTTNVALGGTITSLAGMGTISATSFVGNASTATALATGRTISASGDATGSSAAFTGAANATIPLTLATVNSTTGAFGSGAMVPVITVNGKGLITNVSTVSIASPLTFTGDVTGSGNTGTPMALTLATVNSNTGSFGSASSVPVFSANGKGLITSVTPTTIALDASQVTSGTFANARISQSSVTQYQSNLVIAESQVADTGIISRNADNETITGTWTFNNPITAATPTSSAQVATKGYVDQAIAGLTWKNSVAAATTANITLSGTQTIDGVALTAGQRVLVKNQSAAANNGIYVVASVAWTRSTDANTAAEVDGLAVFVLAGTTQIDTAWVQTGNVQTIGTDSMVFSQFAGANTYTAGNGLVLSGNAFSVGTASSSRITVGPAAIDLALVTNSGTGTFQKLATDGYGRVTGTTPVVVGDITGVLSYTGDVSTSGTTATLATVNTNIGQFAIQTVNGKGLVTAATNLVVTGDVTGTSSGAGLVTTLATVNSSPVTTSFSKMTTNGKGLVTATTPVVASDITALVNATYVQKAGDTMSGSLNINTTSSLLALSDQAFYTQQTVGGATAGVQLAGSGGTVNIQSVRYSTTQSVSPNFSMAKVANNTAGTFTAVSTGDLLGVLRFSGGDGAAITESARIQTAVNGTVSSGVVPGDMTFVMQGTEAMRISSTGNSVGIGNTTPGRVGLTIGNASRTGENYLLMQTSTNALFIGQSASGVLGFASGTTSAIFQFSGTSALSIGTGVNSPLVFFTGGTGTANERMRINSTGNVSINANGPSAFGSGFTALEVGPTGGPALWGTTGNLILSSNALYNGTNWVYMTTATAQSYRQGAGVHTWYSDVSGTAGTTYTPTLRMMIDTTGNVGIGSSYTPGGATVPSYPLEIRANNSVVGGMLSLYDTNDVKAWRLMVGTYASGSSNPTGTFAIYESGVSSRFSIAPGGAVGFGSPGAYGTAGQVLQSNGASAPPTWVNATPTGSYANQTSSSTADTVATSTAVDSFLTTTYRSAKYQIQITDTTNSAYEITELLVIHDGTNVYMTTYGDVFTGSASLGTFDATIASGTLTLYFTATAASTKTVNVFRTAIAV